ncbi:MAG: RcnB family protein [Pseudomonadota bacterium]
MKNSLFTTALAGMLLLSPIAVASASAQSRQDQHQQDQNRPNAQRNDGRHHAPWARGQRLGAYNGRYAQVDYRSQHLRTPPRGYHWVRSDDGDFLLAAVATGLITQVILSGGR